MAERRYLKGYDLYRVTLESLNKWDSWLHIHPEFRRRLLNVFNYVIDRGGEAGVGGAFRRFEDQKRVFLQRYDPVPSQIDPKTRRIDPNIRMWAYKDPNTGQQHYYWKKVQGADLAAPGNSYHEATTKDGYCLAVDLVGDTEEISKVALNFGLQHFAYSSEPWHFQPYEIPGARRFYDPLIHEPLDFFVGGRRVISQPISSYKDVVPKADLRLYDYGTEVFKLHMVLKLWGFYYGPAKLLFDTPLQDAVKRFQVFLAGRFRGDLYASGVYNLPTQWYYMAFLADQPINWNSYLAR